MSAEILRICIQVFWLQFLEQKLERTPHGSYGKSAFRWICIKLHMVIDLDLLNNISMGTEFVRSLLDLPGGVKEGSDELGAHENIVQ